MRKGSLSFLLALMLCLAMLPAEALALDLGSAAAVGNAAAEPVLAETAEEAAPRSARSQDEGMEILIPAGVSNRLSKDLTIPYGKWLWLEGSLTVTESVTLTVLGALMTGHPVTLLDGGLTTEKGKLTNGGGVAVSGGTLNVTGGYDGNGEQQVLDGTVSGVEEQVFGAPVISIGCVAASGKPRLTWNAVGGAGKYEVWRAYSQNGTYYKMGSTSGTGYTNLDAVAGKTYYYKVRAVSADGNVSDFSGVKNMTCDYARPAVSIGCDGSSGKPTLSWKAVSGATKYEIWRATGAASGTYTKLDTVTETTYADASAEAGSTYYYKVRALGSSSYATSAFSTVKAISCCEKPVFSISCKAGSGKPVLSWEAVDGAAKYEVWRAYSSAGTYYKMGETTGTTYTNTSAKANTTYYYKIRAIDANGNYASAFSSIVSAKATK